MRPEEVKLRDAYEENPKDALEQGIFFEEELRSRAALWREVVGGARQDGPWLLGDNYVEVRYEGLLKDAPGEMGRLLRFLGARSGDPVVEQCVRKASFENMSKGRSRGEEDPNSLLRKGVSGDWKNVFIDGDKEIFKEEAGDLLVELGYEDSDDW